MPKISTTLLEQELDPIASEILKETQQDYVAIIETLASTLSNLGLVETTKTTNTTVFAETEKITTTSIVDGTLTNITATNSTKPATTTQLNKTEQAAVKQQKKKAEEKLISDIETMTKDTLKVLEDKSLQLSKKAKEEVIQVSTFVWESAIRKMAQAFKETETTDGATKNTDDSSLGSKIKEITSTGLKIQNFNGYISNFEHCIITISSKYIASMKEHPNLPLEPTYNQSSYPKLPQKPQKPSFPLISPYYHSKFKFLTEFLTAIFQISSIFSSPFHQNT